MSDLDDFMSLDPLDLTDADIDKIIAAQRKHRALVEGGVRVKKDKGPSVSLDGLLTKLTGEFAPQPKITRR